MRIVTKFRIALVGGILAIVWTLGWANSQSTAPLQTHPQSMDVHIKGKVLSVPDRSCGLAVYAALAAESAVPIPKDTSDPKWCADQMSKALQIQATEPEWTPWVPTSPVMTPGPPGEHLPGLGRTGREQSVHELQFERLERPDH